MALINENYLNLKASYLFAEIDKRVQVWQAANSGKDLIRLGIGDVTLPLPKACIEAFHRGVDEMADSRTFKGYGPYPGYQFLREKIAEFDFKKRGCDISADEIFVSDGSKCDVGNIQHNVRLRRPDPCRPLH